MAGRSIRIFLVDGTPSGVRTAELGLSTIKALAVPRASLLSIATRPEAKKTGVYVLIGPDPETPGQRMIYIGEADTLIKRVSDHNRDSDKDFWEECVFFLSKDENLTKAHGRYLEARLIALAKDAKRAKVKNGTAPKEEGRLPEPDAVEMDEFIAQARILLGSLGYDLFEPSIQPDSTGNSSASTSNLLGLQYSGDGYSATATLDQDAGQIIVKAGSKARKMEAQSLQPTYKNLRKQLQTNGVLQSINDTSYEFTQDYSFSSPTAAAQVVSGITINGRIAWKLSSTGQVFAEWEDAQLPTEIAGDG
ncbi:GIY-YIG nuclease family protein [Thermomonas sp. HDW16]|uniref:GIY-YIG nuclease family protein n=1 Tax=Thermomonas sp. HDW16 TaxID=2714945 RepID=UPI00140CB3C5|nr:GIY-YIG nuclease family protein [Thermomonas sp. HDW16]QIL21063.1 GIY-YIG nuclease family protein [Thermomonas sp. HDW16]